MILLAPWSISLAADNPPRLFFADADLSFTFPDQWNLEPLFPDGPLFNRLTSSGSRALITCVLSDPLDINRMATDLPPDTLRRAVNADLQSRAPSAKVLFRNERQLAGHSAYELTWQNPETDGTYEYQSEYFFLGNRIYTITLRAPVADFPPLVPDFQAWLANLQLLSRRDAGTLIQPAHAGIWIHQVGGIKIAVPDPWLIGVADDERLGATVVQGEAYAEFVASVDVSISSGVAIGDEERQADRHVIESEELTITGESDEPFHGLAAVTLDYEGTRKGRFVKGRDVWVASPHGRWLFNMEGDGPLYNKLSGDYRDIMNGIQFL